LVPGEGDRVEPGAIGGGALHFSPCWPLAFRALVRAIHGGGAKGKPGGGIGKARLRGPPWFFFKRGKPGDFTELSWKEKKSLGQSP